jgi:hypothetical protein
VDVAKQQLTVNTQLRIDTEIGMNTYCTKYFPTEQLTRLSIALSNKARLEHLTVVDRAQDPPERDSANGAAPSKPRIQRDRLIETETLQSKSHRLIIISTAELSFRGSLKMPERITVFFPLIPLFSVGTVIKLMI